ncbi:hypothetical protein RRG08_061446 [Elysia crispata]|uniref:Uncharacterized protein n=1 Tax=Elysia crispata TaxID=231223 RepID=A0AAE0YUS9_9GAST|nr:hypothetical protein RRG08_061446 [Elysia crispata]
METTLGECRLSSQDIHWKSLVKKIVFGLILPNPRIDFNISPTTITAGGNFNANNQRGFDPTFDCPVLRTPCLRNLYRLYTTVLYAACDIQLGLPTDHLSKLSALETGHSYFIDTIQQSSVREALIDLHTFICNKDGFLKLDDMYDSQSNAIKVVSSII